jgi:hypothetical protein
MHPPRNFLGRFPCHSQSTSSGLKSLATHPVLTRRFTGLLLFIQAGPGGSRRVQAGPGGPETAARANYRARPLGCASGVNGG